MERRQHNIRLLFEAFDVPRSALVIEHGPGLTGEGALPPECERRLLIDFKFDRDKFSSSEMQIKGEITDTERIIQEHLIPRGWPSAPQAVVWHFLWYYLGAYAPQLPSMKSRSSPNASEYVRNASLEEAHRLLPRGGKFIMVETGMMNIDGVIRQIDNLHLPYRNLSVLYPEIDLEEGALVFEK